MQQKKFVSLNLNSPDARVKHLKQICEENGIGVYDFQEKAKGDGGIAFIEPRLELSEKTFEQLPDKSLILGFDAKLDEKLLRDGKLKYISLSADERLVTRNNYLTARAIQQIIKTEQNDDKKKTLMIGWGRLTKQMENVFSDTDKHILDFNDFNLETLSAKYGDKAHYKTCEFQEFPVIINTIPSPMVKAEQLEKVTDQTTIYELASPPYGFSGDMTPYDYRIKPGLPGKHYPKEAAFAVYDYGIKDRIRE